MKKSKILLVRAPESQGRPEQIVANAIHASLLQLIEEHSLDLDVAEFKFDAMVPKNGTEVYAGVGSWLAAATQWLEEQLDETVASIFFIDAGSPLAGVVDYMWYMKFPHVMRPPFLGIAHSSVKIPADILFCSYYQNKVEAINYENFARVFVASKYLEDILKGPQSITYVGGLPLDPLLHESLINDTLKPVTKINPHEQKGRQYLPFAWNHRLSDDKGWKHAKNILTDFHEYFKLFYKTSSNRSYAGVHLTIYSPTEVEVEDLPFPTTIVITKSREEYKKALKPNIIYLSFAELETFGYSMLDAIAAGGIPLMVSHFVYLELYSGVFIQKRKNYYVEDIDLPLNLDDNTKPFLHDYQRINMLNSADKMAMETLMVSKVRMSEDHE